MTRYSRSSEGAPLCCKCLPAPDRSLQLQATHFVSHSWSGNFFDLVDTVCAHLEKDSLRDTWVALQISCVQ